jgi:hypothetical protein
MQKKQLKNQAEDLDKMGMSPWAWTYVSTREGAIPLFFLGELPGVSWSVYTHLQNRYSLRVGLEPTRNKGL